MLLLGFACAEDLAMFCTVQAVQSVANIHRNALVKNGKFAPEELDLVDKVHRFQLHSFHICLPYLKYLK
jgi:hypothetical protein